MLDLDEARERILSALTPLPTESIPLHAALGRVCAGQVTATIDLPPFDNSAMDGYAVRAQDVAAARPDAPVTLAVAGSVPAGRVQPGTMAPATCVRVFTGSPLPAGADAVVMQEDTRLDANTPARVMVLDRAKPWENVRFRGEDVKQGAVLAQPGERLAVGRLGLLAASGVETVRVGCRPVVALLATGSELVEAGQPLGPGKIIESNRLVLASLLERAGVRAQIQPLVPDTLEATARALNDAFAQADAVVTSGGVSVGEFDFVKQAFSELGGEVDFWRISIKPGKPFVFGRWQNKFLFGLPGNPVSAIVTFLLLVRPAMWRLQGGVEVFPEVGRCLLDERLVNQGDRRHFVRVRIDEAGRVRAAGVQASHLLASLAAANGLVEVPPATTIEAGTIVPVIRFGD